MEHVCSKGKTGGYSTNINNLACFIFMKEFVDFVDTMRFSYTQSREFLQASKKSASGLPSLG